jgi:hypothetical protein
MSEEISVRRFRDWASLRAVLELRTEIEQQSSPPLRSTISSVLSSKAIPESLEPCLAHRFGSLTSEHPELKNLRGRPAHTLEAGEFRANTTSTEVTPEEVLLVRGHLSHPPLSIGDDIDPEMAKLADEVIKRPKIEYERTPFEFRVLSNFKTVGRESIVHEFNCCWSNILTLLRPDVSILELLEDQDITLEKFRLGFERFKSRVVFSVFGLTPHVAEKFYLDLSCKKTSIFWEKSSGFSQRSPSLENSDLIQQLGLGLEAASVCPNFMSKIQSELSNVTEAHASKMR